jgi:hypothetical protein
MKKKDFILLLIFAVLLILFAVLSTRTQFHDVNEYITISKHLAGINNINVFTGHSSLYPAISSIFLKIHPSVIMLKIINTLWIFLIGLVLLLWLKNRKAFILFAFSPLTWYMSIQTTPVLPASFFLLLAFIFFKKQKIKYNYFYSGIFLGLSFGVYTPMIIVSFLFILIYFWDKNFLKFFTYLIAFLIGLSPRLLLDLYLYGMPFYTILRYFGANFIISLGLNSNVTNYEIFYQPIGLLIFIFISPFLFRIYKINWKEHKREILFLGIIGIIFLVRAALLKYFLILSPIIIIYLSHLLSKKEIKWHCIFSIILICFFTFNYFSFNQENKIQEDLEQIIADYPAEYIIAYPSNQAQFFASLLWENNPRIVWFNDFNASLNDEEYIRGYNLEFDSKIPLKEKLIISASFNRFEEKDYSNYVLISTKEDLIDTKFSSTKCYESLCILDYSFT